MRKVVMGIIALLIVAIVAGCSATGPAPVPQAGGFEPVPQQSALARLAADAGYDIMGIPWYDGTHWAMFTSVPGCPQAVVLTGDAAPEAQSPTGFRVQEVDRVPFTSFASGEDGTNMSAADLLGILRKGAQQGC